MMLPSFGVQVIPGSCCKACQNLRKALFPHDTSLGNPLSWTSRFRSGLPGTEQHFCTECKDLPGKTRFLGVRVGILGIGA